MRVAAPTMDGGTGRGGEEMSGQGKIKLEQTVATFRSQYEKFYRQLRSSLTREGKLIKRLKDVKSQLVDNAERLELALKARENDELLIRTLRAELERALHQASSSRMREQQALQLVEKLREEVKALTKYSHVAFSERRRPAAAAAADVGRAGPRGAPHLTINRMHQESLNTTSLSSGNSAESMEDVVPDFATWKLTKNIRHDHVVDKGDPSHLKHIVSRRRVNLRTPMERAEQRQRRHPHVRLAAVPGST